MVKRTVKMQLTLVQRSAISFDGEGGGKIKFDFDATQTAVVAELLLAGESLINATLVFVPGDSNETED